jgi:putative membrane protein
MAVREELSTKTFRIRWLNRLNTLLSSRFTVLTWSVLLIFPVFVLITLLLMLFGQDYDSVAKGFTETTTWAFSQKEHPPYLEHTGHYLCTVAACGSPRLVRPLRWGKRGGRPIIVNRQLQIANAFEELVADFSPALHRFLRTNYDKYGYDLSQKINTPFASNLTYLLMKPLEWFFLLCLYTFCLHPEKKIEKQYRGSEQ